MFGASSPPPLNYHNCKQKLQVASSVLTLQLKESLQLIASIVKMGPVQRTLTVIIQCPFAKVIAVSWCTLRCRCIVTYKLAS